MKTLYAACLSRLGLSQTGAAELHDVRLDTVKSWSSGRHRPPQGAWDELRSYADTVLERAGVMRERFDASGADSLEINIADADALNAIAAAELVLRLAVPIIDGETEATIAARKARLS